MKYRVVPILCAFGLGWALMATPPVVMAVPTTYTYTGNGYDKLTNADSPVGAYTTTNSITGFFTTSDPLANDTSYDFASRPGAILTSYSFTDGRTTLSSPGGIITHDIIEFAVLTDTNGLISEWQIELVSPEASVPAVGELQYAINTKGEAASMKGEDKGTIEECTELKKGECKKRGKDEGRIKHSAGSWTRTSFLDDNPVASNPEPSSLLLLASGLAGLVYLRRRKRAA